MAPMHYNLFMSAITYAPTDTEFQETTTPEVGDKPMDSAALLLTAMAAAALGGGKLPRGLQTYPTKGQKPFNANTRFSGLGSSGHNTGRINVCLACRNPVYRDAKGRIAPLFRLLDKSVRTVRLYTHQDHFQASNQRLRELATQAQQAAKQADTGGQA